MKEAWGKAPLPLRISLRATLYYFIALVYPGVFVGALGEHVLSRNPGDWILCFPDYTPAAVTGGVLALILPVLALRLPRIKCAVYALATPVLVTMLWMAVEDQPILGNWVLRWWLSNQVPVMLVATCLALWATGQELKVQEYNAARSAKATQ